MLGTFSGTGRTFEDLKKQVRPEFLELYKSIRNYCLSLGDKVIEDVRMHRVVFCKSFTFRWFADAEPANDKIILKIRKSRKVPAEIFYIKDSKDFERIKPVLKESFEIIT